jgi:mono/diheme cytochrome c family protein
MSRLRPVLHVLCILAAAATAGCGIRKAMYDQPKNRTLGASDFFADGSSARPLVPGTVARGQLHEDAHLYQGLVDGKPAETFPFPMTAEVLRRGHERYGIYCTPCHDALGTGNGMVVQRGFKQPPSYHIDRLRQAPPGYFFDVMTKGFGTMPGYAAQVKPEDRWAIAGYIRALQLSQNATINDVPETERAALEGAAHH